MTKFAERDAKAQRLEEERSAEDGVIHDVRGEMKMNADDRAIDFTDGLRAFDQMVHAFVHRERAAEREQDERDDERQVNSLARPNG